ncbi:hypothetical protein FQZ97_518520 [compost metagenome]
MVGVSAVGIEDQRAVAAGDAGAAQAAAGRHGDVAAGLDADHRAAVGAQGVGHRAGPEAGHHVAGNAAALGHRGAVGPRLGHVVDDVDLQRAGAGVAVGIGDLEGEGVERLHDAAVVPGQLLRCRGQLVGVDAVGVEHQVAVGAGGAAEQGEGVAADPAIAHQRAAGELIVAGRVAAERQRRLAHTGVGLGADLAGHRTVADLDGQGGGAEVAVAVDQGVGEDIGVIRVQRVGGAVVGVAAVGVEDQRAVAAGDAAAAEPAQRRFGNVAAGLDADHRATQSGAVGAQGVGHRAGAIAGHHVAGNAAALAHRGAVGARGGYVVDDVDHQRAGAGVAVGVGDLEGKDLLRLQVVGVVAGWRGDRGGQGIGVGAVGTQLQGAVEPADRGAGDAQR